MSLSEAYAVREVKESGFCAAVGSTLLTDLMRLTQPSVFHSGSRIVSEGEPSNYTYVIISGCVKAYKDLPGGRRQIVGFLFAGDLIGYATHGCYASHADALTDVRVSRIERSRLQEFLTENPDVHHRMLEIVAGELMLAHDRLLLLGRATALEKVASFLMSIAEKQTTWANRRPKVSLPMSRTDIADYLGLTIETTSRMITRLRKDGVISLDGTSLVYIENKDKLATLLDGE